MREYCTYMDSVYLDKGMALHESLLEHGGDFRLHVVCFDELTERVLRQIAPPRMEIASLAEVERYDPELAAVRSSRSKVEYLWTATPCVTRYFRDLHELDEITYLDADIRFFASPEPLFEEMGDASVMITPASSSPQHYSRHLAKTAGLFVVQFMPFRSDSNGREALEWWRERCIEYCSAHYEDGRMGDQKYLDDWPYRFDGVHVLAHPGGGLGPWNIESRRIERGAEGITVEGRPLVFFHYMGLQTFASGRPRLASGRFRITADEREWIYEPYLAQLERIRDELTAADPEFATVEKPRRSPALALRQAISSAIGLGVRMRVRVAPHWNVGPYVKGGFVPEGYEPTEAAASATYSTSASDISG